MCPGTATTFRTLRLCFLDVGGGSTSSMYVTSPFFDGGGGLTDSMDFISFVLDGGGGSTISTNRTSSFFAEGGGSIILIVFARFLVIVYFSTIDTGRGLIGRKMALRSQYQFQTLLVEAKGKRRPHPGLRANVTCHSRRHLERHSRGGISVAGYSRVVAGGDLSRAGVLRSVPVQRVT